MENGKWKNECHAEFISLRESFEQHLLNREIPKQVRNDGRISEQALKEKILPLMVYPRMQFGRRRRWVTNKKYIILLIFVLRNQKLV